MKCPNSEFIFNRNIFLIFFSYLIINKFYSSKLDPCYRVGNKSFQANKKSKTYSDQKKNEKEKIKTVKTSVGANGVFDMENFVKEMDNANYSNIIEYNGCPTILLLPLNWRLHTHGQLKYADYIEYAYQKTLAEDTNLPNHN